MALLTFVKFGRIFGKLNVTRKCFYMNTLPYSNKSFVLLNSSVIENNINVPTRGSLTETINNQLNLSVNKNRRYTTSSTSFKEEIDGIDLHWKKYGVGKTVVLCCTGLAGSTEDFVPLVEQLDLTEFTLMLWDPPGYGRSRPPNRNVFTEEYPLSKDAMYGAKLMKKLRFDRYSVFGWSLGGVTAAMLASEFPTQVEKLIICNSPVHYDARHKNVLKFLMRVDQYTERDRRKILEIYEKSYVVQIVQDWMAVNEKNTIKYNELCTKKFKGIKCPTLYIGSPSDFFKYQKPADLLQKLIPGGCQKIETSRGGHNFADFMPEFLEQFKKFLS